MNQEDLQSIMGLGINALTLTMKNFMILLCKFATNCRLLQQSMASTFVYMEVYLNL